MRSPMIRGFTIRPIPIYDARAVHSNIIPTTTGAARAIFKVIPDLKDRFDGQSLRVSTATVSVADFVVTTRDTVTVESVNAALRDAAEESLKGLLGFTTEPLVSQDFRGDTRCAIVDGLSTVTLGANFVKVLSWYDNEWAFSQCVAETVLLVRHWGGGSARTWDSRGFIMVEKEITARYSITTLATTLIVSSTLRMEIGGTAKAPPIGD